MQITILSVTVEQVPGKDYKKAEVAYRDQAGKVMGKKIMSFVNKDVFATVEAASSGEVYDVVSEKDKNNFWQWVAFTKSTGAAVAAPASGGKTSIPSPKSTYETPEERAKKQVYIVRQSSISAALNFLNTPARAGEQYGTEEVIAIAKEFEDYVFSGVQQEEEVI